MQDVIQDLHFELVKNSTAAELSSQPIAQSNRENETFQDLSLIKHAFLVGIAGSGMLSLAEALSDMGYVVQGSDLRGATDRLIARNIKVYNRHTSTNIPDTCSFLVWSSAVDESNPEIVQAKKMGIRTVHRADLVSEIARGHNSTIGVSGSHGKTSTTSLIYRGLLGINLEPSYLLGGDINGIGGKVGSGKVIVVESDESDRSFLKIVADFPVVTNIDHEHMSAYKDEEDIDHCFRKFVSATPFFGRAFLCMDCPRIRKIFCSFKGNSCWYGFVQGAEISATNISSDDQFTYFSLIERNKIVANTKIGLPGKHMVQNALAAYGVAREFGITPKDFTEAIAEKFNIGRRSEVIFESSNFTCISDYAHHPAEVKATIEGFEARYSEDIHDIKIIFEPHRYSRTKDCFEEFVQVFSELNQEVYLLPVYSAGEVEVKSASSQNLYVESKSKGANIHLVSYDTLNDIITSWRKSYLNMKERRKLILISMGAGMVDSWIRASFNR